MFQFSIEGFKMVLLRDYICYFQMSLGSFVASILH